jgi:prophage regulatory protein
MSNEAQAQALPTTGFIRLPTIIGNPKSNPPIPPLIPVCKSSWWAGVKSGN